MKSASASFRSFMAEYLDELGFKSYEADNDIWLSPATKGDRFEYYEYVTIYVDDILVMSDKVTEVLELVGRMPQVKFKGSVRQSIVLIICG